ncbi:50S ribosomal protein L17 [Candidatus Phycorickettsia trachydisci]|uniref:50S ribosomal protein L17 n=1 Tax=Candidatus Phycorickettsia trachydisci TaxID=2115978 RepID=A0A2P1P8W1_9RICK|nr:50S ribosomal protein L17 [Candidatus Phycorickettsia trachydisci]AVP87709.1 50S ribosomal protein L17 [Candidatus Phycorickettsia trachydisci]
MRHGIAGKKLSMTSSHRKALLRNLAVSLIMHDQIKTTLAKAKLLRPYIEKIITKVKKKSSSGPIGLSYLGLDLNNDAALYRLLTVVAKRYIARPGGYTRIIKESFRKGDGAPMAYIELIGWQNEKTSKTV